MRPHARLRQPIGAKPLHRRAELLCGVENVTRQLLEAVGHFGVDAKMPELELDVRPGEFERSVAGFCRAIFGDEPDDLFSAVRGCAEDGDLRVRARVDHKPAAQPEHRIEDRTGRARERFLQSGGIAHGSAPG